MISGLLALAETNLSQPVTRRALLANSSNQAASKPMPTSKRLLFIAGEVVPFTKHSDVAELVRTLPEEIQEAGDYEMRVTMPRYGSISERKHRLHEVIRLSGTEISMGDHTETLTVKVASVPDTRLQVYFMDNEAHFGRKGTFSDKNGTPFEDNAARALFYSRAVLETIKKLRWAPDVVHAFGWIGGLAPLLLKTEYAGDSVFEHTRIVYTPDGVDANVALSSSFAETMDLKVDDDLLDRSLSEIGLSSADAAIYPPSASTPAADGHQLSTDSQTRQEQLVQLYEQVSSEVPA